jgi:hypothetical protein
MPTTSSLPFQQVRWKSKLRVTATEKLLWPRTGNGTTKSALTRGKLDAPDGQPAAALVTHDSVTQWTNSAGAGLAFAVGITINAGNIGTSGPATSCETGVSTPMLGVSQTYGVSGSDFLSGVAEVRRLLPGGPGSVWGR